MWLLNSDPESLARDKTEARLTVRISSWFERKRTFACVYSPHRTLLSHPLREHSIDPGCCSACPLQYSRAEDAGCLFFLKSLYNPSLGLVRSTPDSCVYYIAGENLLVEKAISSCDPTISQAITSRSIPIATAAMIGCMKRCLE